MLFDFPAMRKFYFIALPLFLGQEGVCVFDGT